MYQRTLKQYSLFIRDSLSLEDGEALTGGYVDGFKLRRGHPGSVAGVTLEVVLQLKQIGGLFWREQLLAFRDC